VLSCLLYDTGQSAMTQLPGVLNFIKGASRRIATALFGLLNPARQTVNAAAYY
jgi:hypothetical protein